MSAPQQLRLVGRKRESTKVRAAKRRRAQEERLAFEYDNTLAAVEFLQPKIHELFGKSRAGWLIWLRIERRFEDEMQDYVTGHPTNVSDANE
jgi:hypothetical protein